MSGHSKWATIKHKKGGKDAARGKLFAKLIRQVEVAARSGGSDLDSNATLRTMYQKARDASVPLDTIERAGPDVEILARIDAHPALVRSGAIMVSIFHPELAADTRLHELFLHI